MARKAFEKVLNHPDKNLIVKWLSKGVGVREVTERLKEKYPDDKEKHITFVTLQKFRRRKLKLQGEVLSEIKHLEKDKAEDKVVKKLPAYKNAIRQAAEIHVDIRTELAEMITLVKSRIEELFDKAATGQTTINEEKNLQNYFPILANSLDKWMKYVEKVADQTIETNVNITVIEDQMSVLREAVKETLEELDPTLTLKFLDKLSKKMDSLNYRKPREINFKQIQKQVHKLSDKVEEITQIEIDEVENAEIEE